MPEINFEVSTDLSVIAGTSIDANYEETAAQLRELLAPYESMVVTEDNLPGAKSDLARVRKLRKSLDDYRKSVKKAFTAPVTAFEAKCKSLAAIMDTAEANLSGQISEYTERAKAEKFAALEEFFLDVSEDIRGYVAFEQISNPRWANTTFSIEDAQEEIRARVGQIVTELNAIRDLASPYETALLDDYKRNHDITACLRKHRELTELAKQEEERKAAAQKAKEATEAKRRAEEEAEKAVSVSAPQRRPDPEPDRTEPTNVPVAEQTYTVRFEVEATAQQLNVLKAALVRIGVTYRAIR